MRINASDFHAAAVSKMQVSLKADAMQWLTSEYSDKDRLSSHVRDAIQKSHVFSRPVRERCSFFVVEYLKKTLGGTEKARCGQGRG
jgi:hypothetical protein